MWHWEKNRWVYTQMHADFVLQIQIITPVKHCTHEGSLLSTVKTTTTHWHLMTTHTSCLCLSSLGENSDINYLWFLQESPYVKALEGCEAGTPGRVRNRPWRGCQEPNHDKPFQSPLPGGNPLTLLPLNSKGHFQWKGNLVICPSMEHNRSILKSWKLVNDKDRNFLTFKRTFIWINYYTLRGH